MYAFPRSSGILLHPTSLPGPFGIGDLGPSARQFVDDLASMRQTWWQMLPLTPTSLGDSPYFSPSAMAGNPLLISPEECLVEGWLEDADLGPPSRENPDAVDFGAVHETKRRIRARAFERFHGSPGEWRVRFEDYAHEQADWLDDFALFMALKEAHGGAPWTDWPAELACRDPAALARERERHGEAIARHQFTQFLFDRQMGGLRAYAHERGVRLIGDMPIFVAHDSADVWAHPDEWKLDEKGRSTVVAGVPPDYFSATGQLWGNPHYDWDRMAHTGYRWWVKRFRALLRWVDVIRLDHFRGFAASWEVPAGDPTAEHGRWVPGPGAAFFASLREQLGELPILAEDLGVITPDVVTLRDTFHLPGMKILQFAFDTSEENNYFPHLFPHRCVVYPGTHDNDTARGWYAHAKPADRELMREYVGYDPTPAPHWAFIRLGHASVADLSIVALQDLLGLGSEARMNRPGTMGGNWRWRMRGDALTPELMGRFQRLTALYDRSIAGSAGVPPALPEGHGMMGGCDPIPPSSPPSA